MALHTQTARFRTQLIINWKPTLDGLTTLSVHSNRDIRAAATDALTACLQEASSASSSQTLRHSCGHQHQENLPEFSECTETTDGH